MGGNLLRLGRISKGEYIRIETELRDYLERTFGERYRIPRYYRGKPDFGDMDIILSDAAVESDWHALQQSILHDLGIVESLSKRNLLSTAYRGFQVDFFLVPAAELDSTWHFLCYNDLGNLLGKIYRRFGLKYGMDGLFHVFRRASGNYRHDVLLSRDWRRILGFLELGYERWNEGFETLEEMFDWVISCKYFSVRPFLHRSRTTSVRAEQRTTVREFIAYLENKNVTRAYPFAEDRSVYLPKIADFFSDVDLYGAIERERELEEFDRKVQAKFNGKLVMGLFPELKGKELGHFIRRFKSQYEHFATAMYQLSQEQIVTALRQFHAAHIQDNDS